MSDQDQESYDSNDYYDRPENFVPIEAEASQEDRIDTTPITLPDSDDALEHNDDTAENSSDRPVLSEEERRQALIYAEGLRLYNDGRQGRRENIPLPESYGSRLSVWLMLFAQAKPFGFYLLSILAPVVLLALGVVQGHFIWWTVLVILLVTLGYAWVACRIYALWSREILYCNEEMTGIYRPTVRWLLILKERDEYVNTADIISAEVSQQSNIASLLRLNLWIVTIDTASEKDEFLHDMKYVVDGKELVETAMLMKRYATQ